ncbi:MAG: hypothetical protein RRA94_02245 [Bacteroidota bacterium]|nr:hypothetical protein [Bacteroidota bacterium]
MRALPIFLLPVLLLLAACGGGTETVTVAEPEWPKYRYVASAELTQDYIASQDGTLRVLRPDGWQKTSDPKNAPSIVLWLVREDYSASLSFTPMQMDPALYQTLTKEGIAAVARVSLSLKERNAEDSVTVVQAVELFKVGDRVSAAYEYRVGAAQPVIRVVVFDTGSRFMECTLYPATVSVTPAENRRLFEVQQTVLASLVAR